MIIQPLFSDSDGAINNHRIKMKAFGKHNGQKIQLIMATETLQWKMEIFNDKHKKSKNQHYLQYQYVKWLYIVDK